MDHVRKVPGVGALRTEAFGLLDLRPGASALEAGCGMGDVSRDLARLVAPGGAVTGVDFSHVMISEARRRQAGTDLPVTFEHGDARSLRFEDGVFDAVWTERMLSHLADAETAIAELVRVLRPGGRLVVLDADVSGTMIDHPDRAFTAAFEAALHASVKNPYVGRGLRRLLVEAGLVEVVACPRLIELPYPLFSEMAGPMLEAMTTADVASADAGAAWERDLAAAHAAGTFCMATSLFLASGTKP